jgi:hypothetical protein
MKIVLIGQQDFGKAALEAFLARGDEVVGVFCRPEKPGSKGWDAAITRICNYGQVKIKSSGKFLFVFNTHFEVNNSFIFSYCSPQLPPNAQLITPELFLQHPKLP